MPELAENRDFWCRRRVVVTGGAGFFGRAVVDRLRRAGCQYVGVPRRAEFDLTRRRAVDAMLRQMRPDVVIHLAAVCGGIGANQDRPAEFFYQNLIMGLELMEASRLAGVEKFVAVGTVCAYPKLAPLPLREENLWDGYPAEVTAPYGLAKKILLVQAQVYRRQYGFNAIYLIPTNLYGPGDNFDLQTGHVIPALIRRCIEARDSGRSIIHAWGTGRATRDFLFVEDAARAVLLAAEHYNLPEPLNIGSGRETSIAEVAELIRQLTGCTARISWDASRPDGQPRRVLDVRRARELLGFVPQVSLEEGLRQTIAYYEHLRRRPSAAAAEEPAAPQFTP